MNVTGELVLAQDDWIALKQKSYRDTRGHEGRWSYAERIGRRQAVVVAARTQASSSLIVIRQYRIPFERPVLEFPAGLVDPGEGLAAAAVRELLEETGYQGVVEEVGPELSTSAGLSTETIHMVYMRVPESPAAPPRREASEAIEVIRVRAEDASGLLARCREQGLLLDAKLYIYLRELQAKASRREERA